MIFGELDPFRMNTWNSWYIMIPNQISQEEIGDVHLCQYSYKTYMRYSNSTYLLI